MRSFANSCTKPHDTLPLDAVSGVRVFRLITDLPCYLAESASLGFQSWYQRLASATRGPNATSGTSDAIRKGQKGEVVHRRRKHAAHTRKRHRPNVEERTRMTRISQKMVQACAIWLFIAAWLLSASPALARQSHDLKQSGGSAKQQHARPVLVRRPRYRIHPGDVLVFTFPISPNFNQTQTVAPDGYVSLLDVGQVYVAGQTLPQVHKTLYATYSKILHHPIVNVDLKSFQQPYFVVSGEVAHPGRFNLLGQSVTVVEGLAMAGGETTMAKTSQVLLFRRLASGSMVEVRKLNLKKMLKKGNLQEDPILQAGDLVYVPQNRLSKIGRFLPTSSLGFYAAPPIP